MINKKVTYILLSLAVLIIAPIAWLQFANQKTPYIFMEGKALGVFFAVSYQGDARLEKSLDSMINEFDKALNYNRPDSEISRFNRNGYVEFQTSILYQVLLESNYYTNTYKGAVNHLILPLILAWGQDFSNKRLMSEERIEELKSLCQPENLEINPRFARAKKEGVMINLSYIDKGYLIDLLTEFLLDKGVRNFQIEFGTDAVSYGKSPGEKDHKLVIINPEGSTESKSFINETKLKNLAYSSSGNFEKFYVDDKGFKHSHLLDPRTGRPIENKILSAHIKAPTCTQADALATICMILTLEESQEIISSDPNLEGLIVYNERGELSTWKSKGFDLVEGK
ncbi:MAG TPA: FAD:protein FMN transferase [Lunatimonas sp.]|nr:FAD:protein FMN transferase [Lunatimonas sp.]